MVRPDEIEGAVDQGLEVITVPAVRLDQVMADQPVDVVKVDVEGHELAALRGAPTLLGVTRPRLVVEAGWVDGDPWASDLADLYRLLVDEHRYRLWTVVDFVAGRRPLTLERFIDTHLWPFEAWNFVALPDGDVLEARVRG